MYFIKHCSFLRALTFFVRLLEELKILEIAFEIYWPLARGLWLLKFFFIAKQNKSLYAFSFSICNYMPTYLAKIYGNYRIPRIINYSPISFVKKLGEFLIHTRKHIFLIKFAKQIQAHIHFLFLFAELHAHIFS